MDEGALHPQFLPSSPQSGGIRGYAQDGAYTPGGMLGVKDIGVGKTPSGWEWRNRAMIGMESGEIIVPPPRGLISEKMGMTSRACSGESRKCTCH